MSGLESRENSDNKLLLHMLKQCSMHPCDFKAMKVQVCLPIASMSYLLVTSLMSDQISIALFSTFIPLNYTVPLSCTQGSPSVTWLRRENNLRL